MVFRMTEFACFGLLANRQLGRGGGLWFWTSYICKFAKYPARPFHTFLFVTSTSSLADKLDHIAGGLVKSSRSGYLAQGL